jgi:hypothetical protein
VNTAVFLGDVRLNSASVAANQITFQIPATTPAGPLTVRIEAGGERSFPITIPVESSTLRINSAALGAGPNAPLILLEVQNLGGKPAIVTVNGKEAKVLQSSRDGDKYWLVIELPETSPAGTKLAIVITSEARTSDPFSLTIGG